jgi:hypothetical protein
MSKQQRRSKPPDRAAEPRQGPPGEAGEPKAPVPPVPPPIHHTPPPHLAEPAGREKKTTPEEPTPHTDDLKEEIDHAGLDMTLPGEDAAPGNVAEEHAEAPALQEDEPRQDQEKELEQEQ